MQIRAIPAVLPRAADGSFRAPFKRLLAWACPELRNLHADWMAAVDRGDDAVIKKVNEARTNATFAQEHAQMGSNGRAKSPVPLPGHGSRSVSAAVTDEIVISSDDEPPELGDACDAPPELPVRNVLLTELDPGRLMFDATDGASQNHCFFASILIGVMESHHKRRTVPPADWPRTTLELRMEFAKSFMEPAARNFWGWDASFFKEYVSDANKSTSYIETVNRIGGGTGWCGSPAELTQMAWFLKHRAGLDARARLVVWEHNTSGRYRIWDAPNMSDPGWIVTRNDVYMKRKARDVWFPATTVFTNPAPSAEEITPYDIIIVNLGQAHWMVAISSPPTLNIHDFSCLGMDDFPCTPCDFLFPDAPDTGKVSSAAGIVNVRFKNFWFTHDSVLQDWVRRIAERHDNKWETIALDGMKAEFMRYEAFHRLPRRLTCDQVKIGFNIFEQCECAPTPVVQACLDRAGMQRTTEDEQLGVGYFCPFDDCNAHYSIEEALKRIPEVVKCQQVYDSSLKVHGRLHKITRDARGALLLCVMLDSMVNGKYFNDYEAHEYTGKVVDNVLHILPPQPPPQHPLKQGRGRPRGSSGSSTTRPRDASAAPGPAKRKRTAPEEVKSAVFEVSKEEFYVCVDGQPTDQLSDRFLWEQSMKLYPMSDLQAVPGMRQQCTSCGVASAVTEAEVDGAIVALCSTCVETFDLPSDNEVEWNEYSDDEEAPEFKPKTAEECCQDDPESPSFFACGVEGCADPAMHRCNHAKCGGRLLCSRHAADHAKTKHTLSDASDECQRCRLRFPLDPCLWIGCPNPQKPHVYSCVRCFSEILDVAKVVGKDHANIIQSEEDGRILERDAKKKNKDELSLQEELNKINTQMEEIGSNPSSPQAQEHYLQLQEHRKKVDAELQSIALDNQVQKRIAMLEKGVEGSMKTRFEQDLQSAAKGGNSSAQQYFKKAQAASAGAGSSRTPALVPPPPAAGARHFTFTQQDFIEMLQVRRELSLKPCHAMHLGKCASCHMYIDGRVTVHPFEVVGERRPSHKHKKLFQMRLFWDTKSLYGYQHRDERQAAHKRAIAESRAAQSHAQSQTQPKPKKQARTAGPQAAQAAGSSAGRPAERPQTTRQGSHNAKAVRVYKENGEHQDFPSREQAHLKCDIADRLLRAILKEKHLHRNNELPHPYTRVVYLTDLPENEK